MARRYIYQMNRAVGIQNKGDRFQADPDDPKVVSLVGAGYADLVMVQDDPESYKDSTGDSTGSTVIEGDENDDPVRPEPGDG